MKKIFLGIVCFVVFICFLGVCVCGFCQDNLYTDKDAKFSILLDQGWRMNSSKTSPNTAIISFINISSKDSPLMSISRSLMMDAQGVLEYYALSYLRDLHKTTDSFKGSPTENIKLNDLDCIRTIAEFGIKDFDAISYIETIRPVKSIFYFFRKGSYYFVVRTTSSVENFEKDRPMLEKMISTIKVTE